MIKTLRITSVVAVVLAVFFFVFPAVFSVRSDEQVEQFLSFPGVIEKFSKAKGDSDKRSESQISPLVKEAQAFALYLNPPPKPKKETRPIPKKTTTPRPQAPVSPKFKLIGVSYYASHPELSLALIDEPGRGTRWVRQSSKVSHLIIEQVKDGLVVVRDGKRTFELGPERREEKSLVIKGSSSGRTGSKSTLMPSIGADAAVKSDKVPQRLGAEAEIASLKRTAVKSDKAQQQLGTKKEVASLKKTGVKSDEAPQQLSAEEEMASLKKAINGLEAMKADVESGESDTIIKEFISDLETEVMSISAEEAKNLGHLGKDLELKDVGADLNRAKDRGSELAELGAAEPKAEAKAEPEVPKAEPDVPKAEPEVPKAEPEVPKTEPEDEKGDEAPEGETARDEPSESETPAAEASESKTPENRRELTFCGYTQSQLMELHRTNPKEFWDMIWNCDDI